MRAGGTDIGGTTGVLTWLDRTGKVLSTVGDLKAYAFKHLALAGRQAGGYVA